MEHTRTARWDNALGVLAFSLTGRLGALAPHFHEECAVGLLERGCRTLSVHGDAEAVKPGDILLLAPGDLHGCSPCGNEDVFYRGFHIGVPFVHSVSAPGANGDPCSFRAPVIRNPEMFRQLREIHERMLHGGDSRAARRAFRQVLAALFAAEGTAVPERSAGQRRVVETARSYLERHAADEVVLDDLCAACCLSKSALLRAFSKGTGTTPHQYLKSLRTQNAARMLQNGTRPSDAAAAAGFSDQSHLTNTFRRFLGITPARYAHAFSEGEMP